MDSGPSDPTLDTLSADILAGMREWQLQHPDATFTEIEHALDERWYRLRARMLEDLALQCEAATWQSAASRPTCLDCGRTLPMSGGCTETVNLRPRGAPLAWRGHLATLFTNSRAWCIQRTQLLLQLRLLPAIQLRQPFIGQAADGT